MKNTISSPMSFFKKHKKKLAPLLFAGAFGNAIADENSHLNFIDEYANADQSAQTEMLSTIPNYSKETLQKIETELKKRGFEIFVAQDKNVDDEK